MRGSAPRFSRPHPLLGRKDGERDAARINSYLVQLEVKNPVPGRAVTTIGDMQGTGDLVSSLRRYDLTLFSFVVCQRGRKPIPAFLLY